MDEPSSPAGRGGAWFRLGAQGLRVGAGIEFTPATKDHLAPRVSSREDPTRLAFRLANSGRPVTWDGQPPEARPPDTSDPWGNRVEIVCHNSDTSGADAGENV